MTGNPVLLQTYGFPVFFTPLIVNFNLKLKRGISAFKVKDKQKNTLIDQTRQIPYNSSIS